jgi:hypothetical protein
MIILEKKKMVILLNLLKHDTTFEGEKQQRKYQKSGFNT